MNLFQNFTRFISTENLFSPTDKLLLAVSGGLDSVVLCALCEQAGYNFIIAHCNFQLRDAESLRDEQFVQTLAAKYNRPVLIKRFNTTAYAKEHKVSIQVAARELRYAWFNEICNGQEQPPINFPDHSLTATHHSPFPTHLLTAHHLDDNIETMLMNFFKGTGIAGLRGILPKQGNIVRPLLFAKKEELKTFAEAQQLEWVEDSSNKLDKYARNYFRHQLIPLVKNLYPEAESNLAHNLQRFKDIELLYHQSIDQHKKKLLEFKGNEIHIPILKLLKTIPLASVLYEIIKPYDFSPGQVEEVIDLLSSETGRYLQSATHRIIKNRHWLIISPNAIIAEGLVVIHENQVAVHFEKGQLAMQLIPRSYFSLPDNTGIACLDAKDIAFPLLLRKWKTGDYFYPLGMRKKKKLARFFIDQKLSKTAKEKTWVLESNKKIIWIVGLRIDERCKVTDSTQQVLRIELKETAGV